MLDRDGAETKVAETKVSSGNKGNKGRKQRCQEPLLSPGGCRTGSCGSDGEQGFTSLGHCSANCMITPVDGPRRAKLGLKLLQTAHLRFLTPLSPSVLICVLPNSE